MASTSEVGHAKNIYNFEMLIAYCTNFGSNYNPSNPDISLANCNTLLQQGRDALILLKSIEATFHEAESVRMVAFKPLKKLATRVIATLASSTVPATVLDDAVTINRKIQGKRANNEPNPAPAEGTPDRISVSQASYDMQLDHFEKLLALLQIQPAYNPNEADLSVSGLISYKTQLQSANSQFKSSYANYKNAVIGRNELLYNPAHGLVNRAKKVKQYVKAAFGGSSQEYQTVNSLNFKIRRG